MEEAASAGERARTMRKQHKQASYESMPEPIFAPEGEPFPAGGSNSLRRIMCICLLGQVAEWYDYGLYGLLARQLGATFFPSGSDTTRLLSAFAVFGIAFFARPLGGMLLGQYGDRLGRKRVFIASLALMTAATGMVGIIPGASTVGTLAPFLLVAVRIAQGISAAGEATSSITYVFESVPPKRRGFYAALLVSGNSVGFLLAESVIWLTQVGLDDDRFELWGWRIPFLIALPLGSIGFAIQRHLRESPLFEDLKKHHGISRTPLRDTFTVGLVELLRGIGLGALAFVANYLVLTYLPTHLRMLGFSARETTEVSFATTFVLMVSYPIMGALSDIVGRKPLMIMSAAFFLFFGWPIFAGMSKNDILSIAFCTVSFGIGTAAYVSVLGVMYNEYIAASRRMVSYSTGFNLSGAIFGGTSLWIFGKLASATGDIRMPAAYLVTAAFISIVSLLSIHSASTITKKPYEGGKSG